MNQHVPCREKTQLSVLMGLIRQTVQEPLQRLPALTAVYLAEASCVLTHPGCDLFPAVSRHLLRKPSLNLEVGVWCQVCCAELSCQRLQPASQASALHGCSAHRHLPSLNQRHDPVPRLLF